MLASHRRRDKEEEEEEKRLSRFNIGKNSRRATSNGGGSSSSSSSSNSSSSSVDDDKDARDSTKRGAPLGLYSSLYTSGGRGPGPLFSAEDARRARDSSALAATAQELMRLAWFISITAVAPFVLVPSVYNFVSNLSLAGASQSGRPLLSVSERVGRSASIDVRVENSRGGPYPGSGRVHGGTLLRIVLTREERGEKGSEEGGRQRRQRRRRM